MLLDSCECLPGNQMDVKQGAGYHNECLWAVNTGFGHGPSSGRSTQVLGHENWFGSTFSSLAIVQKHDVNILPK